MSDDQPAATPADPVQQHPELLLAAALAGGFVLAKVLRRIVG